MVNLAGIGVMNLDLESDKKIGKETSSFMELDKSWHQVLKIGDEGKSGTADEMNEGGWNQRRRPASVMTRGGGWEKEVGEGLKVGRRGAE